MPEFSILLPDQAALAEVLERVEAAGVRSAAHDQGWLVRDPSRNAVVLTVKADLGRGAGSRVRLDHGPVRRTLM
jgi:hypothetical protein